MKHMGTLTKNLLNWTLKNSRRPLPMWILKNLPATAQVAAQHGAYLACFNFMKEAEENPEGPIRISKASQLAHKARCCIILDKATRVWKRLDLHLSCKNGDNSMIPFEFWHLGILPSQT